MTTVALVSGLLLVAYLVRWWMLPASERPLLTLRGPLAGAIRSRLGGYRQLVNEPDEALPQRLASPKRVAVVGAGLGGIGAAANLAERGFEVTLIDGADYLGGKVGAWHERADDGSMLEVEHGFHAFFRHYYNLGEFLDRCGVRQHMTPIDDYWIVDRQGEVWRFGEIESAPVLNLLALGRQGLYRMRDLLEPPTVHEMDVFLSYDKQRTYEELDGISLADFSHRAQLPARLRMVFTTFARAFFADERRLSMAELVKSFHFYYLSHDHGLLYDYPAGDYQRTVIAPLREHLESRGVRIVLGQPVERIGQDGEGFEVLGERYDYTVLATNVVAARAIAEASEDLARRCPETHRRLTALRPSQRYAVWRIWIDRPIRDGMPVFVSTERRQLLDAVAVYENITEQARRWRDERGGSVLELHSYAVPDEIVGEEAVRCAFLEDLEAFFPELSGLSTIHESLHIRADFTAFHVGMAESRPEVETELEGLLLAGDWVALPFPAMLMEAAYSAGLMSANAICAREGLREAPVYSVPQRGILAGMRRRPSSRPAAVPAPDPATHH